MITNRLDDRSFYLPEISFNEKISEIINNEYISPIVDSFFKHKGIKKYDYVEINNHISDLDFNEVEVSYFYEFILHDLEKNKSGDFFFPIKYIISFDKGCCINSEKYYDNKEKCNRDIHYNEVKLFEKTILYFIFIDLNDIMVFVRKI